MTINNPADVETNQALPPVIPLPPETRFDKQLNAEDMSLLQDQWNVFNNLKQAVVFENPILRRKQEGGVDLPQGTLIHGTSYDLEKLQKIKELGIVSGELVGEPEENETHYCADFFRVPDNMSVSEYLEWCRQPISKGMLKTKRGEFNYLPVAGKTDNQIAFIVDTGDPRLEGLTRYDAYGSESGKRMESIVNFLPRKTDSEESRTTSAILVGIPSNFISGIIVSDLTSEEEISKIKNIFGEKTLIYKTSGQTI